jgi:predicted DNA-binding transcriptional regulator YafY
MARQNGGDKRSSWGTFQRRLGVARRLVRGPATPEMLITAVQEGVATDSYPSDARSALRHDLAALRREFGCVITFRNGFYTMEEPGQLSLLDLPDEELEALVFLETMIAESTFPNMAHLNTLLERIISLLPSERRHHLDRLHHHPQVDGPSVTYDPPTDILTKLKQVVAKQQISFAYQSPYQEGRAVTHRVAPSRLFHREGHTYLDAYCYECDMEELSKQYHPYRLSRIVPETLQVLPQRLPPTLPPRPVYSLRYVLSPTVACQHDISHWFKESRITFQEDGSALVEAQTHELWHARQVLLRYREHCRVLEPPELIAMLRETLARMNTMYREEL